MPDNRTEIGRPYRAFEMELHVGADTIDDLIGSLRNMQFDIERGSRDCVSGGPASGYTLKITERPEMTHERYIEELDAYLAAKKE